MPPQPALPNPNYWTVEEVATMARVSPMTTYRLVKSGDLGHQRVGRAIRIPEHAITTYFNLAPPSSPALEHTP